MLANIPNATYGLYSMVRFCFSTTVRSVQLQTSARQGNEVTNDWTPKTSRCTGTMGSSTRISIALALTFNENAGDGEGTSQQSTDSPNTQRSMIPDLHSDKHDKPHGRRLLKELVIVRIYVEFA